jgi:hypothetical protein
MLQDRRLHRSQQPRIASRYCLQNLTKRHELSAMVLSDDRGRLVAGAEGDPSGVKYGAQRVADGYGRHLASLGPTAFETSLSGAATTARFGEPVNAMPVHVDGRRFYLVTVGTDRAAEAACAAAMPAIVRIFAA